MVANAQMSLDTFSFTTAGSVHFGWGSRKTLAQHVLSYGRHALLLHSKSVSIINEIIADIEDNNITLEKEILSGEPTDEEIGELAEKYHAAGFDVIIAIGGGSVLDSGKALSALLTNPGELMDYLEVVGKGQPLQNRPCPLIALPTTSGTGTEVTKNAVIKVVDKKVKVSMRNPAMIPAVAIIDPELTVSVPAAVTASTGMDAFIQVLEPFCSRSANRMVDLFCREGIPLAARNLPVAYHQPENKEARTMMAWVSLLGGLSLANAKLGAVHGFAGPIGGMFDIPHGVICACLLPQVFRMNLTKVQDQDDHALLERFSKIAAWVMNEDHPDVKQAIEWFIGLNEELEIPKLKQLGIEEKDHDAIISKALVSSSMKGNPVSLDANDLREILLNS